MAEAEHKIGCVAVLGGTGFLGTEIVAHLAAESIDVRVGVRQPDKVRAPADTDSRAKIEPVYADVRDESSLAIALQGCDAAVNAVGLYVEEGADSFEAVHERGAANLARQCAALGIQRLVHVSGIGAEVNSESPYVRARARGEQLVRDVMAETVILRPSVLFGPHDKFINTLAQIIKTAPVVPMFGNGLTRLQPAYVDDVAAAAHRALVDPKAAGQTYELGGASIFTYREILELVMERTHKRRVLLPLPFPVWDVLAAASALLPASPITRDQVALMKDDNVVAQGALSFADLGIDAKALEEILPDYAF